MIKELKKEHQGYMSKPSGLITINSTLTLSERKVYNTLLHLAIEELKHVKSHDGVFKTTYKFIKEQTGLTQNHEVVKCLRTLRANPINFDKVKFKKGQDKFKGEFGFLGSFKYKEDVDYLDYQIPHDLITLLLETDWLHANLNFQTMQGLKNKHSLWLYELIQDYRGIGSMTYNIEEIRAMAGLTDKQYKLTSQLVQKIINPAVEGVKKTTHLKISVIANKKGRTIESFTFKFYNSANQELKRRKMWQKIISEYWLNEKLADLDFYISKNKSGKVLIYDTTTKKPLPKEQAFLAWDILDKSKTKNAKFAKDKGFNSVDEMLDAYIKKDEN